MTPWCEASADALDLTFELSAGTPKRPDSGD